MLSAVLRFAVLTVFAFTIGQVNVTRAVRQAVPPDIDPDLTKELLSAEQDFWNAAAHNDAEALNRIVAPEFALRVADIPQGSLPRAMWMKNTVAGLTGQTFQIRYSAARRLADDLAAVSQLTESKGTIEGRDQSCVCYVLDLWKKRDGQWQIIARYTVASDRRRERGSRPIPPPTDIDPQLTATLTQLEQELGDAGVRGFSDTQAVDRLVSSEFTLRTSDAPDASVSRAEWLQPSGPYRIESFEEQYHAARKLADDVSAVSFLLIQKARGGDRSGTYYVVDIWKHRDRRWQLVARYSGKTLDPMPHQATGRTRFRPQPLEVG